MRRFLLCLAFCLLVAQPAWPAEKTPVRDDGRPLPSNAVMEQLARKDPVAFLENCVRRYNRDVKGYTLTFQKQERIGGQLQPREVIEVAFRDKPHSVFFNWQEGARKAERALYVEGENDGKLLARPNGGVARLVAGDVVKREVNGSEASQSGRYTLDQFGLKKAAKRALDAWKAAKEKGELKVEYLGVKDLKEAGDRPCWVLKRTNKRPERDGVMENELYIDTQNWLQIGSVLKDDRDRVIGAYYFRDIRLNPEFKEDQFTRAALKP
jgi:hypothetical protein